MTTHHRLITSKTDTMLLNALVPGQFTHWPMPRTWPMPLVSGSHVGTMWDTIRIRILSLNNELTQMG